MADEVEDPELVGKVEAITDMPYGPARLKAWGDLLASMPSGHQRFAVKELAFWEIYGSINDDRSMAERAGLSEAEVSEMRGVFDATHPGLKTWPAEKGRFVIDPVPGSFKFTAAGLEGNFTIDLDDAGLRMKILNDFSWPTEPIVIEFDDVPSEVVDLIAGKEPYCFNCHKPAYEVFAEAAAEEGVTPAEYARDDGTYNPNNNRFACDACYIAIGMPSSDTGWKAP